MYKPKHKRPTEVKVNGKVATLAASAVMLATPVLQSVSPAFATEDTTDSKSAEGATGATAEDIVTKADADDALSALSAQVGGIETVNTGKFVLPSAADLTGKLDTAKKLINDKSTDIDAINTASEALTTSNTAYSNEVSAYNKLNDSIGAAKEIDQSQYKGNLLTTFKAALSSAENVFTKTYKDSKTFIDEANNNAETLDGAQTALVNGGTNTGTTDVATQTEKDALKTALAKFEALNKADYTADSYAAAEEAYDNGNKIYTDTDATSEQVNSATTAINTAIGGLVKVVDDSGTATTAEKAVLRQTLNKATAIKPAGYTNDTYQNLQNAIQAAQSVYLDKEATSNEVSAANANVQTALDDLVAITDGSTTTTTEQALRNLVTQAETFKLWDYTQASWNTLNHAKDNAKYILSLDNPSPSQTQLDDAYDYLSDAIDKLVEANDSSALKQLGDLYTQVGRLSASDFTTNSWAKVVTARNAAEVVLEGGFDASVSNVQTAYDNLQTAIKGLVSTDANYSEKTKLSDLYSEVEYYTKGSTADDVWATFVTARDNAAAALKSDDSTVIDYMVANDALTEAVTALGDTADTSYIATAAYRDIDGVGKVFFSDNQGIVLYNKPEGKQVKDADGEGRMLANESRWKVMRQATLQDGSSWYEVGKNQWVNARFVMIEEAQIGQIDYLPDMGVNLWAFEPDGLHFTGRRLDNGSQWEMWGSMMINGQQYFNLGANQWVNAEYIAIAE